MQRACGSETARSVFLLLSFSAAACAATPKDPDAGPGDAGLPPNDGGLAKNPCATPGSWVHDSAGTHAVPGGTSGPDLSWLSLPVGFCAHHFAIVPNARQLRFAPGGELFVASPTTSTTSFGTGGLAAIVVVPDDNQDGVGDRVLTFKNGLPSTQGLLFANGYFYYQDRTKIFREPYTSGQRADTGTSELVADINGYTSTLHWPKTLDISDTGHIFVGNGGDQGEACVQPMPFHGGILELEGLDGGAQIAMGLRNPIDVKCHHDGHDHCFATELALDYSAAQGGREKLVPIREGDNWGFPCCATQGLPYSGVTVPCSTSPTGCAPDCSQITADTNSFIIGNTPFGFDFEDNLFAAPWDHKVVVALHGEAGTWAGARLVAIATDPSTGLPLASSTTSGGQNSGNMVDFATGWDDRTHSHGRPTDVDFSPDGRLFVSDDQLGEIFWIAPLSK